MAPRYRYRYIVERAPSGDLRLSWDPFLRLYSASLRSLLDRSPIYLTILIVYPRRHTPFNARSLQQHLDKNAVPSYISQFSQLHITVGKRQHITKNLLARFFSSTRRYGFGLHLRESIETRNPLSGRQQTLKVPLAGPVSARSHRQRLKRNAKLATSNLFYTETNCHSPFLLPLQHYYYHLVQAATHTTVSSANYQFLILIGHPDESDCLIIRSVNTHLKQRHLISGACDRSRQLRASSSAATRDASPGSPHDVGLRTASTIRKVRGSFEESVCSPRLSGHCAVVKTNRVFRVGNPSQESRVPKIARAKHALRASPCRA